MKNTFIKTTVFSIIVLLLSSCSKDDVYISLDQFKTFNIYETLYNSESYTENVQTTETFSYSGEKLQTEKLTQTMSHYKDSVGNPISIEYQSVISYNNNEVTVTGSTGDKFTYILNSEGFASTCKATESGISRNYEFSYKNDYLSSVIEIIKGNISFQMELFYENGNLSRTETEFREEKYAYNFTATEEKNISQLPLIHLTEIYPLSFHKAAIYAGILGKAPKHFIQQLTLENTSELQNYTYKYDANGYLTECTIETKNEVGNSYRGLTFSYE